MPLNCHDRKAYPDKKCADCSYLQDERCCYFVPSTPLSDILTTEERLGLLEGRLEPLPQPEWTEKQWDKVQQLQSEVVGWRPKLAKIQLAYDKAFPKNKEKDGF